MNKVMMPDLTTLPLEILSRIAAYLSISDCHNLAVTHGSFQDAAESQIWSHIVISPPENVSSRHRRGLSIGYSEDEEVYEWETDSLAGGEETEDRAQQVLMALQSRPRRAKQVKRLSVDISGSIIEDVAAICTLVHRSVIQLNLTHELDPSSDPWLLLARFRDIMTQPFERVSSLAIPVPGAWQMAFHMIDHFFPHTRLLQLLFHRSEALSYPPSIEWPFSPKITELHLTGVPAESLSILPVVMAKASGVTKLVLDTREEWLDNKLYSDLAERFIRTLREHRAIEHLQYAVEERPGRVYRGASVLVLFNGTGWERLHTLVMGGGVEMETETYIEVSSDAATLGSSCLITLAQLHRQPR
jgi:hypothetical protein